MSSFSLLVRVLVMTLYPTLHRLIGRNCERLSACFSFGISTTDVSFIPFETLPEKKMVSAYPHKESPTTSHVF